MSTLKFRLATLLRLREMTRDERRTSLNEALRADDALRGRLEGIDRDITAMVELCRRAAGPGAVDVDRLVETQRYEVTLQTQRMQTLRQREAIGQEIQRRRAALMEADREVRVLEKLRERLAEQHRAENEQREVKRLDEVAQQQIMREVLL